MDRVDARAPGSKPPNIILIVTDDQPASALTPAVMPRTSRRLARRGTTFSEAVATTPLCCPARATMLTGQYGHNTGILENNPGWPALSDRANTLPNWLRAAGYRTAHVGKWLHHYGERTEGKNAVAPGWDQWATFLKLEYFDYKLRVNGRAKRYGDDPRDYLTRVLNRKATGLVKRQLPKRKPLYLQLEHLAPHSGSGGSGKCRQGAVPDPRDRRRFRRASLPKPPNFNEADVSDKPSFASERPLLDAQETKSITRRYRCALASLRAVDRGIGMISRAVRRAGERRDTAILLVSDNGYFQGEHRMLRGKVLPYEESVRVPMVILLPPRLAGGQDRLVAEPVANLDLTPTILELAGATALPAGRVPDARRPLARRSGAGLDSRLAGRPRAGGRVRQQRRLRTLLRRHLRLCRPANPEPPVRRPHRASGSRRGLCVRALPRRRGALPPRLRPVPARQPRLHGPGRDGGRAPGAARAARGPEDLRGDRRPGRSPAGSRQLRVARARGDADHRYLTSAWVFERMDGEGVSA